MPFNYDLWTKDIMKKSSLFFISKNSTIKESKGISLFVGSRMIINIILKVGQTHVLGFLK